ncbi:GGDEF domain-containing response regulator [[Phormidium ambiguum] IAM M-71]|uniref:GGDEF domain-containing response regulator n=2 Tax=[Phormidium ambiguum] IAM M-71 TaxID=454136 RepID=A0A1U7II90_9CYAN|nr:GGDEF domain-containing response regulator [Phormidium ambiguum IAM M-71]
MKNSMFDSKTILIVDDVPANLGILTDFLSEANFEVLVAQDGESAIQKLKYAIPDLILLDIMMPGIDGFETYERLKENPLYSQIPVIFISALSETNNLVKGLSLGAVDYIIKPFQKEEVLARIRNHIELRHLSKTLEIKNLHLLEAIEEHAEARAALRQLTLELEARVKERTAELSQTLQNLYESQAQLEHNAFHDSLTGLQNRDWLIKRLQELIATNSSYSVLFIDLDRFKIVNDSLGHLAGDELLKSVATRIQACLKPDQTATRMGGDEFVILVEAETAIEVAQQLLEQFKLAFNFNDYEVFIEASIGITSSSMGYQQPMDILRDVDIAMYKAKKQGGNSYQVFDPQMQAEAIARLELEQDLRKAMPAAGVANDQKEFCLHYQPIVSLNTGKIKAFEALVRWQHPKGMISPDRFIPIAEETGLINPLGWWILHEACSQLKSWQNQLPNLNLIMNVNFSPVQFQQINLFEGIAEILQQTGIAKNSLNIEIIETCLLKVESFNFQSLKQIGVTLSIDDFCTGYSSLNMLRDLPIHALKIDRSFVQHLSDKPDDTTLIETIISLGKNLKMEVVAEGVETQEQVEILRKLGCNWAQGYFFARPLNVEKATKFLMENKE